jgi:hypothetical protein
MLQFRITILMKIYNVTLDSLFQSRHMFINLIGMNNTQTVLTGVIWNWKSTKCQTVR